jgi:F0F1-type ATP synthase assembly protein I
MTSAERIEKEIADMKHQMETIEQKGTEPKGTQPKRSGFFGLIGAFIIGFILGLLMGYLILA